MIDARRGDGPPKAIHYTMPALITSDAVIARDPDAVAAAVRALVKTQKALKADVSLATKVGRKLFPDHEASLIADIVERDLPFYDPVDLARVRQRHDRVPAPHGADRRPR